MTSLLCFPVLALCRWRSLSCVGCWLLDAYCCKMLQGRIQREPRVQTSPLLTQTFILTGNLDNLIKPYSPYIFTSLIFYFQLLCNKSILLSVHMCKEKWVSGIQCRLGSVLWHLIWFHTICTSLSDRESMVIWSNSRPKKPSWISFCQM